MRVRERGGGDGERKKNREREKLGEERSIFNPRNDGYQDIYNIIKITRDTASCPCC